MTTPSDQPANRYVVGIDLGTTNCAVAYVDTSRKNWVVADFDIPQLVAPAEVDARPTLPSFHYEAAPEEFGQQALDLPWSVATPERTTQGPAHAVGIFARDHGAAVPGRQISSAKSWLSHNGVDRTAALLPWHGAGDVTKLSPVQVSARYLQHIHAAWNHRFPQHPLAQQDVVLTVPASFDEVARELTVEAARLAGLRVVLVEEPQAAFYAWIYANRADWEKRVKAGQKILVCDIGGGTTDFTLIRVRPTESGSVVFHRIAVGEHLILGGDNLDLALAHHVEKRLGREGTLDARQWGAVIRSCRQAKETLLGPGAPDRLTISLPGAGSRLIGGALQTEVTRDEVQTLLVEGFLPRVTLDDKPAARRSGFQEFGLPYAPDPAVTRYLAAFLTAHRKLEEGSGYKRDPLHDPARPELILFNGGFFESPVLRERLLEVLSSWFPPPRAKTPWEPKILKNARLDLAVARGAAYYGMVRRGLGVRIKGGLAHTYYVGVETPDPQPQAVCLMPAGVEEGHDVEMTGRTFNLLIRQPVEFPLFVSSTRTTDQPGELLPVDAQQMSSLPPIRTVLQSGKKAVADTVTVNLHAKLTEIGTLELWCAETSGDRRWRLQFDVRAATQADGQKQQTAAESEGTVEEDVLNRCRDHIRATFARGSSERPEGLVKRLEQSSALSRHDWPPTLMRGLWETLMEVEANRAISMDHEVRWLNLTGFCLRPGYGLAVDDWRVAQTWKLSSKRLHNPRNEQARAEWWILWRRIAGGLTEGQQRTLAEPLIADWRTWFRKSGSVSKPKDSLFQFGPHESAEVWRLLGVLELLPIDTKIEIGQMILDYLARPRAAQVQQAALFALGRIGTRVPVYGPLNMLVTAETAEGWIQRIISTIPRDDRSMFSVVQLSRLTNDRHRDIAQDLRHEVDAWLTAGNAPPHYLQLIREGGTLGTDEQKMVFGETLPRGLRIE